MIVYFQGEYLPLKSVTIPVTDHGFLYGIGLFETFRSWRQGRFFHLDRHLNRLATGCEQVGIQASSLPLTDERKLKPILAQLLHENNLEDAVFRYTVSAGDPPGPGLPAAPYSSPREMVLVRPIPPLPPFPISLYRLETPRTPPETATRVKSFHFLNNIAGHREMRQEGSPTDEGIFFTSDGRAVEGTISNIFIIKDGVLKTPPLSAGPLPGIARGIVLDLAGKADIPREETDLYVSDFANADAAFITNAALGIRPADAIGNLSGEEKVSLDPAHPAIRLLLQGWAHCLDRLR